MLPGRMPAGAATTLAKHRSGPVTDDVFSPAPLPKGPDVATITTDPSTTPTTAGDLLGSWVIAFSAGIGHDPRHGSSRVMTTFLEQGDVVAFLAPGSIFSDDTRTYQRSGHGRWVAIAGGGLSYRYGAYTYNDRGAHTGEAHVRASVAFDPATGELTGTYERRDLDVRGNLCRFRSGTLRGFRSESLLHFLPTTRPMAASDAVPVA